MNGLGQDLLEVLVTRSSMARGFPGCQPLPLKPGSCNHGFSNQGFIVVAEVMA
jgi:hypothetical protein